MDSKCALQTLLINCYYCFWIANKATPWETIETIRGGFIRGLPLHLFTLFHWHKGGGDTPRNTVRVREEETKSPISFTNKTGNADLKDAHNAFHKCEQILSHVIKSALTDRSCKHQNDTSPLQWENKHLHILVSFCLGSFTNVKSNLGFLAVFLFMPSAKTNICLSV